VIKGHVDEEFDGFGTSDSLRELLANPESHNAYIFPEESRRELLFQLFQLLVLGGGTLCQPDHNMQRYLQLTKGLYKDVLTVYRNERTGCVETSALVALVTAVSGLQLFQQDSPYNFCAVVVDPTTKTVSCIHRAFAPFW
jgi:hypothetical protein